MERNQKTKKNQDFSKKRFYTLFQKSKKSNFESRANQNKNMMRQLPPSQSYM